MKAIWKGVVLANSSETIVVENNHYFPLTSLNKKYFELSNTISNCHWKGKANYYSIRVDGSENKDAAWYYANPKQEAVSIKNHVAFWKGIEIKE